MKYFIYCRKSSEEDTKQSQSLGTQQRILVKLATDQKLKVVDIIKESKSAKTDHNRPLFTKMLERIVNGEADGILVVHTDRLARNLIEAGQIIKLIESKTLKEVRTPTGVYNNVPSLLYMGFDFVFAAHYSRDLSAKVLAGNESKLLKGEYPGAAPLGYINIQPGKGIEPDPIRSKFIIRAFELFATGDYSVKSLAKKLKEEGLRSRYGNTVSAANIHVSLTNPEYYGVIRRKGKLYEGNHQPLITKQTFDLVQDIINDRSRPRKQKHDFIFRDFLVCDACGCKVTAGISKGKYIYYRCTNGKGKCNQNKKYWNKQHVMDQYQIFFDDFTLNPELAEKSFALYKKKALKDVDSQQTNNVAITQQIKTIERKLTRLEDLLIDERISESRYDQRKLAMENELAELKVLQKHKNVTDKKNTLELVENIKNQAVKLSEIYKNGDDEVKRDLLKSVLWNSKFLNGEITSTRLTKLWKPFENLNQTDDLEILRR